MNSCLLYVYVLLHSVTHTKLLMLFIKSWSVQAIYLLLIYTCACLLFSVWQWFGFSVSRVWPEKRDGVFVVTCTVTLRVCAERISVYERMKMHFKNLKGGLDLCTVPAACVLTTPVRWILMSEQKSKTGFLTLSQHEWARDLPTSMVTCHLPMAIVCGVTHF